MNARESNERGGRPRAAAEAEAHARLEALFAGFDRLTPDELAHIGLVRRDDGHRRVLEQHVEGAARSADRAQLVGEARDRARETVVRRYSEGGLHPTWIGLNWGLSQGTVADRVAIVEALEDAAAAAVLEDVLDPAVATELALDADHVLGLASGEVSEGSLARVLTPPSAAYRDSRWRWAGVWLAAALMVGSGFARGSAASALPLGMAAGLVGGGIVLALARRDRDDAGDASDADRAGGDVA